MIRRSDFKRWANLARDAVGAGLSWKVVRLPPWEPRGEPVRYLTVAACVKDEGPFLEEWIEFHRHVGIEHFVLYDNGSTDDTRDVLAPYQAMGIVDVMPWNNFSCWLNTQRAAYAHAIANFGHATRWIGFFDIDEFMFPVREARLETVLRTLEHLPAVCVTGINFGTSGHVQRPPGGVLANFRQGVPIERQRARPQLMETKCFVQPWAIAEVSSAHWFHLRNDRSWAYTEHGTPLRTRPWEQAADLTADLLRYNHYFSRAAEDFARKIGGTDVRGSRFAMETAKKTRRLKLIEELGAPDHAIDHLLRGFRWGRPPAVHGAMSGDRDTWESAVPRPNRAHAGS